MSSTTTPTVGGIPVSDYYVIRQGIDVQFACLALVAYDIVITIDDELEHVWRQRFSLASILYLANRYFVLIESMLQVVTALDPWVSPATCKSLSLLVEVWSIPIIVTLTEGILVLRVAALYRNTRSVVIPLLLLLLFSFITSATLAGILSSDTIPVPSSLPSFVGCFYGTTQNRDNALFSATWMPGLIVEVVLIILILCKTVQHVRTSIATPVLTIILRDGCMYFAVVFALMLGNAIIYNLPTNMVGEYQTILLQPELSIASVLCSRLFLNLRTSLSPREQVTTSFWGWNGGWSRNGTDTTIVNEELELGSVTTRGPREESSNSDTE